MSEIIEINGIRYKKVASESSDYFMVRTYSAGVFYGILERRQGVEVTLKDARRIWFWDGAASLSELAQKGTSKPESCKFPCAVDSVLLTQAIEIIPITDEALKTLNKVKIWSAHE